MIAQGQCQAAPAANQPIARRLPRGNFSPIVAASTMRAIVHLLVVLLLAAVRTRAAETLTNAAQILNLPATQAAQALPVVLRAVVVDTSEPRNRALIVEDASASIYVFADKNIFSAFHRKDFLEIKGVTSKGEFAPCFQATEVRKLGTASAPRARPATYQQLITGSLDAQYVEISGVVRQCSPVAAGSDTWRIVLAADGGTIPVRIPAPQDSQITPDTEVTIEAVCLYQFNQRRQALSPVLQVPRGVAVGIVKIPPTDPYAAPVRTAASLLQYSPEIASGHRIRVQGVVTHSQPGALVWIQDATSGLRLQARQADELSPGDEIDALGFPSYGSSTPVLEDAIFKKIRTASSPAALAIGVATNAYDHQDDLISLEAKLTEIQPTMDGLILTLKKNGTDFKAILKIPAHRENETTPAAAQKVLPAWQPGSVVRVAGICDVTYDFSVRHGMWHPQSFQLLLRSPSDVTVLATPSWWTPKHLIIVLGIFAGILLAISGAVTLVARRRLKEQAQRRAMAEAEFAAILSERNRLAREIHDTLAQGLTATSVQLQLVKIHTQDASETATHHLELAQQMVRGSLEEARNSIWNMRPQVLETGSLAGALKNILSQMAEGGGAETFFETTGRERRLPASIENNVLRLGQEAITNAAKHARAKTIRVKLEFGEKKFALTVTDDGRGFNPDQPPKSDGGFGLVGMAERAKELNGKLKVRSAANEGTEINLNLPLAGE